MRTAAFALLIATAAALLPGRQRIQRLERILDNVNELISEIQGLEIIKVAGLTMKQRMDFCMQQREKDHESIKGMYGETMKVKLEHLLADTHELMGGLSALQIIKETGLVMSAKLDSCALYHINDTEPAQAMALSVTLPDVSVSDPITEVSTGVN